MNPYSRPHQTDSHGLSTLTWIEIQTPSPQIPTECRLNQYLPTIFLELCGNIEPKRNQKRCAFPTTTTTTTMGQEFAECSQIWILSIRSPYHNLALHNSRFRPRRPSPTLNVSVPFLPFSTCFRSRSRRRPRGLLSECHHGSYSESWNRWSTVGLFPGKGRLLNM